MDRHTREAVDTWAGCTITAVAELDGGEVGTVHRVDLADGRRVAVKTASTDLRLEARMLRYLATEGGLLVPDVLHADSDVLVLEYVDGTSTVTPAVERDLADRLAALHDTGAAAFGFPFDTLTGQVRQPNPWCLEWPAFFGEHRLRHAAERARATGQLPASTAERIATVADALPALLDHDPTPALIHGDVWRENLLTDGETVRAVLDPACYFADPEVELAYIDWTGVGGDAFFEHYRTVAGIPDGFRDRAMVYRLYPLLIHVWHFGAGYLDPLREDLSNLGY